MLVAPSLGKFSTVLRKNGYKATPARLSLLDVLKSANHPLTTQEILKALGGKVNQATIYRSLESLLQIALVRQVDMQHGHAHYELRSETEHHHHLICRSCGITEDVPGCDVVLIEKAVLKASSKFNSIQDHSLEFFGHCKKCAKQIKV